MGIYSRKYDFNKTIKTVASMDRGKNGVILINMFVMLWILLLCILLILAIMIRMKKRNRAKILPLLLITCGMTIYTTVLIIIAFCHGADYATLAEYNYYDVIHSNKYSHVSQKINKQDLSGSIIIYYRYGCPDCEAVFNSLEASLQDISDIYWVATRQKRGKQLLKEYPVTEVPSAVLIENDNTYIVYSLCTSKQEGNIETVCFDKKNFIRLMERKVAIK